MRTLFDGDTFVEYSQRFVWGADWTGDTELAFGDQCNGLLGAALPGGLMMIVGLHTGVVPLTVELHDVEPPVDPYWEDVVEATWDGHPDGRSDYRITGLGLGVDESYPVRIPPGSYRVRYCASGMDVAQETCGGRYGDEPELDRYLLQMWPAGGDRRDTVVRQTSGTASYWHRIANGRPPRAQTERLRADQAERERAERDRERAEFQARVERHHEHLMWGGPRPDPPLGDIAEGAAIARLDRPLAEAIAAAGPDDQRRMTRWLLRRGIVEAGLERIEWLTDAAEVVGRGGPLPALFTDDNGTAVIRRLFDDERITHTTVTMRTLTQEVDGYSGQIGAMCGIRSAARDDPARAVFGVLSEVGTTFGADRWTVLFDELRAEFPTLVAD